MLHNARWEQADIDFDSEEEYFNQLIYLVGGKNETTFMLRLSQFIVKSDTRPLRFFDFFTYETSILLLQSSRNGNQNRDIFFNRLRLTSRSLYYRVNMVI